MLTARVERVDYFHGATVVYTNQDRNGASSIGGYIAIGARNHRASSEWLDRATHGRYYYIIHNDTLAEIPIEEFDQVRGMKRYFLKTKEDYEAINFTLV